MTDKLMPTDAMKEPVINGWTPPKRIWLHDLGCGEVTWCEDPDPDGEQIEAVEYIRADQTRPPLSDDKLSGLVETLNSGQWDHIVTQGPNPTGFCTPDHPAPKQAADAIKALQQQLMRFDPSRIEDAVNTITLILDMNYHTAISKARYTARQIVEALSTTEGSDR